MRKLTLLFILSFSLIFSFTACDGDEKEKEEVIEKYEIAMIQGSVEVDSFAGWSVISEYSEENNISHKSYKPKNKKLESVLKAIDEAVEGGAKLIVAPGEEFSKAVFFAQDKYPDVDFILLGAFPNDNKNPATFKTNKNTLGILYDEEQVDYLTGYLSVLEGFKKIGYIGEDLKYFDLGVRDAAKQTGVDEIKLNSHDDDDFVDSWYEEGTEVIYVSSIKYLDSVIESAGKNGKKVITKDADIDKLPSCVVFSITKNIEDSLKRVLKDYYKGDFPGGESLTFTVDNGGIILDYNKSKFEKVSISDLENAYGKLSEWGKQLE